MTISPCSQRQANCCAVKLRWNAAPALNISGRESSPLWLPLNTGKSFCQGQIILLLLLWRGKNWL